MGLLDKVFGGAIGMPEVGAGSALLGYFGTKQGVSAQNWANAMQAEKAMAFEERMSNSAYQRAMADMKAAGLNPMLAASKGGASTPSGQQARMENVQAQALNSAMIASQIAVNKAQAAKTTAEANVITETGLTKAQEEIELIKEQQKKTFADAGVSRSTMYQVETNTRKLEQELTNAKTQNQVIEATYLNLEATRSLIEKQATTEVYKQLLMQDQAKLAFAQAAQSAAQKGLIEQEALIKTIELANKQIDIEIKSGVAGKDGFEAWVKNFVRRYVFQQGAMK